MRGLVRRHSLPVAAAVRHRQVVGMHQCSAGPCESPRQVIRLTVIDDSDGYKALAVRMTIDDQLLNGGYESASDGGAVTEIVIAPSFATSKGVVPVFRLCWFRVFVLGT